MTPVKNAQPWRRRMWTVVLLGVVLVAACDTDGTEPTAPTATSTSVGATTTALPPPATFPSTDAPPDIPDTPAGDASRWVLDQLAAADGPSAEEAERRFAASFLADVPADAVAPTFDQLRALGPFTVGSYEGVADEARLELAGADGARYLMVVGLDGEGSIAVLVVQPRAEVSSWADLDAALAQTGADVDVLAVRAGPGGWDTVHESGDGEPGPLGSIFKLYVLGAVQQAVLDGDIAWTDQIVITDDLRSLPTGRLQEEPEGATVTVAEAAELMISISDNTATDLLIDLVGRDAVDEAVVDMGHHDPGLLDPLLTTRALFQVGWGDPALRREWATGDPSERRDLLTDLPGGVLAIEAEDVTDPVWIDGVDWFGTGLDVAAAHAALQAAATDDPEGEVRRILAINPGAAVDPVDWPYVGFKGGSAPGVLALSWYMEDGEGTPSVLVLQLASEEPAATASVDYVIDVAAQGIGLLADG